LSSSSAPRPPPRSRPPPRPSWPASQRKAIRQAAAGAVADNDAYLALANPNNAAVVAQVRRLTQQNNAIIRRLVQID
jgi:hypothetical protein